MSPSSRKCVTFNKKPMSLKIPLLFLLTSCIFIHISCTTSEKHNNSDVFRIPVIINSAQHPKPVKKIFKEDQITYARPFLFGIYSFKDTVDINKKYFDENIKITDKNRDSLIYSWGYFSHGDDIKYKVYDTVDVNGIDIIPNYSQDVFFKKDYGSPDSILFPYYPVYLVNYSQSPKLIRGKDGYTYGIQEAFDTTQGNDCWYPIERDANFGCGNGAFAILLKPKEFAIALFQKYEGSQKTKMRVRFKAKENLYVSKSFEGIINPKQFNLKDSFLLRDLTNANNQLNIFTSQFYLSLPKTFIELQNEYYEKNKTKIIDSMQNVTGPLE